MTESIFSSFPSQEESLEDETKIWRYMDFAKFVSLLDRKQLFFCRADKVGDPFEGSFSKANIERRRRIFTRTTKNQKYLIDLNLEILSDFHKMNVKHTAINCWHINEDESDAMWKLYVNGNEGIAIQSTIGRLKTSLNNDLNNDKIYVHKVKYTDYDKEVIPESTVGVYFYKRKSFEHENELRAVIKRFNKDGNGETIYEPPFRKGIYVWVDLDTLIQEVYLSPTCPAWQKKVTDSLMRKYNLPRKTHHSRLTVKPQY